MDLGLKDKIAVVQAASQGLGFGVARALSSEGARVVICARTQSVLESAARTIRTETGNPVLPVVCDVSDPAQLQHLFKTTLGTFGRVDILVGNAGGPPPGPPQKFTPADYRAALETNFLSAVESVRLVVKGMRDRHWGRILFITSAAVKQPIQNLILSNSARSALTAYAKTLSTTLAPTGITVNCLLPGPHRTRRLEHLAQETARKTSSSLEAVWKQLESETPLGRLGTIEEFGHTAAFLCSEKASFITGQSLLHDGGSYRGLF